MDADGVAVRLRHLLHTVEAFDDRRHQDDLGLLAVAALQLASGNEVEFLVGAAQLNVGFEGDRVVALRQRVEQLVQGDGLFFLETLVELVALEHLRDGEVRGEADHALEAKIVEPLGVEANFGFVAVEDAEYLFRVRLRVFLDLFPRHLLARDRAPRRIANERGEVSHEEDDGVAEILEVFQLAHQHGVTEVQIGRGGIEPGFDAERNAGLARFFQPLAEIGDADDFGRALLQQVQLLVDRKEGSHC